MYLHLKRLKQTLSPNMVISFRTSRKITCQFEESNLIKKMTRIGEWATAQENLSLGFPTMHGLTIFNQPANAPVTHTLTDSADDT